ncbi:ATP-binding cassette sub-family G member 8 [Danaus plexippus]|uniref:ATP-binding cassette sub-family G member 8 n=1 Tax=Danaus plexippus TaxID=13037 RepID=UPI002AB315EF|nr:ATP-binding cassette sub-family G member 8 [Danaus plexippus]XP_061378086.1 ATP-binding cassette sub-family G member 8 [Danaus plexippus]
MSQSALGVSAGERRYSVPSQPMMQDPRGMHSEDLHAWSIYRQNLNSDFTDSALGSTDKSPLPYGNFQLRDTTVQSILSHPRYGPKSALGSNMYTYLKFGLPRVFPPNHNGSQRSGTPKPKTSIGSGMKSVPRIQRQPRGARENSSGYDSSDNETSTNYKYSRKYRSDPDFRMQNLHPSYQHATGVPLVAMQQAGIRGESHWTSTRNKSVSEANLLGIDSRPTRTYGHRRSSVVDYVPDNDHQSYLMPSSHLGGRMSKAGSHMSLAHSRKHSTLRPGDHLDGYTHSAYIYPNYYVNNLEITSPENKSTLLVSGLSFEVKSGEILAVLATSHQEATGLLDVLAGVRKKLSGDIILNGQPVASSTLRKVSAYVRCDTCLCGAMSVEHTLRFHATLRAPRHRHAKMDDRERINLLIEELGLEQVRDTNVERLTRSEIRRLNVACQLLLDTAVLILDQPTKEMDIFDTFFLVEYLRNWASTGRVVIMSLHPPTYEIFAMLTKVVLISAGRTMFSGYRRDMLPYFASIDYPCPAYKNPSDYYLDLVTLDDLSAAAMLESSGRIESLAGVFLGAHSAPEPPPPVPLPAPVRRANVLVQVFAMLEKSLLYTQMTTLSNVITRILIAAIMSIVTGAVFWDLPSTDPKLTLNDRVGFHYSVMCVSLFPCLVWSCREAAAARPHVERDIAVGLYSRTLFILFDQFMELWSATLTWLAYLVPSYAMSGLYAQTAGSFDGFYIYLGYMLLYLISTQMLCRAAVFVVPKEKSSAALACFCLFLTTLVNGVTLHQLDLPFYVKWLEYVSPSKWTIPEILRRELSDVALRSSISKDLRCTNKQRQHLEIIVQSSCPLPNGTQVLSNFDFLRSDHIWEWTEDSFLVALSIFYAVFALVAIFAFVFDCTDYVRSKERASRKGYKVTANTP